MYDMPKKKPSTSDRLAALLIAVVVVAALYLAKEVLVPFALALLFAFLFSPAVTLIERTKLGRVPSVIIVTILCLGAFSATTWFVSRQLLLVIDDLPAYRSNIHDKVQALHKNNGSGLAKTVETVKELNNELSAPDQPAPKSGASKPPAVQAQPIPVVIQPPSGAISALQEVVGPAIAPLATALIVAVFTIFMLIKREDLRNRFLRLAGDDRLNVVTLALDDAAARVSKFLLMQFVVNCVYGGVFALALYFIHVPYALLWGVLAAVLRFIPYVGTLLAAVMPVALALAVFSGWSHALITTAVFITLELLVANVLEPLVYGAHTGLSALAILISAVFWTLLWGPIGLILSTPLTVCLLVASKFVPSLAFINVLLGDEEVLPAEALFYQRLLAFDLEEARKIADDFRATHTQRELYESVVIPALSMAEADRHQGTLDPERETFIIQSATEMLEEWSGDSQPSERLAPVKIFCLPVKDEADGLTAEMLSQVLIEAGLSSQALSAGRLVGEMIQELSQQEVPIVAICALPPYATAQARALCKRLRSALPDLKIVVGVWYREELPLSVKQRFENSGADAIVGTLREAVDAVQQFAEAAVYQAR